MTAITRRHFAIATAAAGLLARSAAAAEPPLTRAIPKSGERLPVVGLGTAEIYTDDATTRQAVTAVVAALVAAGGRLIDTASSYGDSETVLGGVIAAAGARDRLFIATKLEQPDAAELQRSLHRLKVAKVDLLQLHNLHDPNQSLSAFAGWKAQGLTRYVGVTSTTHEDFAAVVAVIEREKPDFVQIDYSIDNREAEHRVLPAAAAAGAAVLTAVPLGRGRLFRAVRGKPIPDWAAGFAHSWGQFFLKWLIADPRVTAVIPGTLNAAHMTDNLGAMQGLLPDPDQRRRMTAFVDGL